MREFFHGWRRKAGVVTLVIALAFAVVWLRGLMIEDSFYVYNEIGESFFGSTKGGLHVSWRRFDPEHSWSSGPHEEFPFWMSTARSSYLFEGVDQLPIDWDWKWCGFSYAGDGEWFIAIVPHWSIILPLTLLSAYLILWKPRLRVRADA